MGKSLRGKVILIITSAETVGSLGCMEKKMEDKLLTVGFVTVQVPILT